MADKLVAQPYSATELCRVLSGKGNEREEWSGDSKPTNIGAAFAAMMAFAGPDPDNRKRCLKYRPHARDGVTCGCAERCKETLNAEVMGAAPNGK